MLYPWIGSTSASLGFNLIVREFVVVDVIETYKIEITFILKRLKDYFMVLIYLRCVRWCINDKLMSY